MQKKRKERMKWPEGCKRSTYYLSPALKDRLDAYCEETGLTMTFVISQLVETLPDVAHMENKRKTRKKAPVK